ncbi:MAG TPA: dTDP-4-dehydrorhamnose reductase [Gallionellaceae bacterium]
MKKILLTGKLGQVGWELQRTLLPLGQVIALDHHDLDLTQPDTIRSTVRALRPDIIVNAAAYTAVDNAETERDLAMAINSVAPGILAEEAHDLGTLLVHYSTEYVFDGRKQGAYVEDDAPNPLNIYGHSKLAGEQAVRASGCNHLILRTSWVYGARGRNFLLTMLRLAKERPELRVVSDQIGAPTWCRSLAEVTALVLAQLYAPETGGDGVACASGTYHVTSSGSVSWHGFASEILRLAAVQPMPATVAITSADYPTPAQRPVNSVLSCDKLFNTFGVTAGNWHDNLRLCLQEMRQPASETY